MLKASALYMVIIIALVIGILCSSLIVIAYFYRIQYQRYFRYLHLQNNLNSAENILLASADTSFLKTTTVNLFQGDGDLVSVQKIAWGIYDVGIEKAFINHDTLSKVFSMANSIDSTKWAAIYLSDQDQPLALSGATVISGNVFLPRRGVNPAYMDNKYYSGDARLVNGQIHLSTKSIPLLTESRLKFLEKYFEQDQDQISDTSFLKKTLINNSFNEKTQLFFAGKNTETLKNIKLTGNLVLFSDTTVIIDSTAVLKNIVIVAKSIIVKSGFHGTCQLFASTYIILSENSRFEYPSCIGLIDFNENISGTQDYIQIGRNCQIKGLVFTYEKSKKKISPVVSIDTNVFLSGQIYSQGNILFKGKSSIYGSCFSYGFLYQSGFFTYKDYLVNIKIDANTLSAYYLTSDLLPTASKNKKVLQWLESN